MPFCLRAPAETTESGVLCGFCGLGARELVHTLWADDSGDLENNPEFLAPVARAHYLAARLLGALADNPDSLRAEADREFMAAARCSQKAEQLTARLQEALDRVERVRVAPGSEPDGS